MPVCAGADYLVLKVHGVGAAMAALYHQPRVSELTVYQWNQTDSDSERGEATSWNILEEENAG